MNKSWFAVALAMSVAAYSQLALTQITSTATGGAGGAGGAAQGGTATGGQSSNSNTVNSSGGTGGTSTGGTSSASGGSSSSQGGNANAQGGTVTGVSTGSISSTGTGNTQAADITVNYIQPSAPGGIKGLAAGVDPATNHVVNDSNIRYNGSQTIKNTPDVSVGGPASGPCNGFSGGVGVSVPGFAIGANASTVDKGCEARETARIAAMLGRMDLANAVLEHISVVEEALKAKAARDAAKQAAMAVPTAKAAPPAQQQQQQQQQSPSEMEIESARLAEQQRFAVAALQRKATMDKVNDTITFTTAANQEKTPQQIMAEEATRQQAEQAARLAKQQDLERQLAELKSAPANKPAAAPPVAPAMADAPVANAPGPAVASVAAPVAVKPQQSAPANPEGAKSLLGINVTPNGVPANTSTALVAGAQPGIGGDRLNSLLGLTDSVASTTSGQSASPASDDGTIKIATKGAAVPPAAKREIASDKSGSPPGSKTPAQDPVSAAKALLNLK